MGKCKSIDPKTGVQCSLQEGHVKTGPYQSSHK